MIIKRVIRQTLITVYNLFTAKHDVVSADVDESCDLVFEDSFQDVTCPVYVDLVAATEL